MKHLVPVQSWWNPETGQLIHQTLAPVDGVLGFGVTSPSSSSVERPTLRVKRLQPEARIPTRANATDAGLDLYSVEDVTLAPATFPARDHLEPNEVDPSRTMVATGISVEFAPGLGLFIWDRSGLAAKHGIHRFAGVIDAGYTGEVKVVLMNHSPFPYQIKKGDRIAQAILQPVILPQVVEVLDLAESKRGAGGFGSTGA